MFPSIRRLAFCAALLTTGIVQGGEVAGNSAVPTPRGPEPCHIANLRNGFTIRYSRKEAAESATRLWLCADAGDGYVDVAAEQIDGFVEEPGVPPPPASSAPEPFVTSVNSVKDRIRKMIETTALKYQIDPDFIFSVVEAESGFDPQAVSLKGARGLMQLMPDTAAGLGIENSFDPAANVEGGTKYLRKLLDLYGGDAVKALAAYNAGPGRVEQYRGIPPYQETWAYVTRIIEDYNRKKLRRQADSTTASPGK